MRVFALSEHMPRMAQDFYPEEVRFPFLCFAFFFFKQKEDIKFNSLCICVESSKMSFVRAKKG